MSDYTQENRPLRIVLGDVDPDGVLLTRFNGTEAISRLLSFALELAAPVETPLAFGDVIGKPVAVQIDEGILGSNTRTIHGIISRFSQGRRDNRFVYYRAEMVPALWLLTRQTRSRVFQQQTVHEILGEVLNDVYGTAARFGPQPNDTPPSSRNYCVQYRETDFAFASRLMEEEGFSYYFTLAPNHDGIDEPGMMIATNSMCYEDVPCKKELVFQDENMGVPEHGRVIEWDKVQELPPGKVTLTDHHFEFPGQDFHGVAVPEKYRTIMAGTVEHDLVPPAADGLGTVDHPGGYAHWRDGIDQGGSDRAADVGDPLFADSQFAPYTRLGEQMAGAVRIEGVSTYCRLTAGHTFTLSKHYDADGDYIVTSVAHEASCGVADSGSPGAYRYANRFECVPSGRQVWPTRVTPRPFIRGTQTGTVVGTDGEEVEPDKYGRVKVLFHWDPQGGRQLDTSCWVRVAQSWAVRQWGAQFIPRIGDEVVFAFQDGDPDQPIIIGSVYNADNMPIYDLPQNKTRSGIKTHSTTGGEGQNFNELRFEDKKGQEEILIHAERAMSTVVEAGQSLSVGASRSVTVAANETVVIGTDPKGDPSTTGKSTTTVFGDTSFTVTQGNHTFEVVNGWSNTIVKKASLAHYDDLFIMNVKKAFRMESTEDVIELVAAEAIRFTTGKSSIELRKDGRILLAGDLVTILANETATVASPDIDVIGGAVKVTGDKIDIAAMVDTVISGAFVKIN